MSILNFNEEFQHLITYIQAAWRVPCVDTLVAAAKAAFNQGLYDGRFWIDEHLTYRIGRTLNKSDTEICPIERRSEQLGSDSLYDALCRFDSEMRSRLNDIHRSQLRFGKWDYSKNTRSLLAKLESSFALSGLEALKLPLEQQKMLVEAYAGFRAEGIRCNSTPVKLMYNDVIYSKDEQGRGFVYTLFSAIYSHGLACAQEYNDRSLIDVMTSIYLAFRDLPFNVANYEQIMQLAREHELMALFEGISPFEFTSSDEYRSIMEEKLRRETEWNAMTLDQQTAVTQQRREKAKAMIDSILDEIKQEREGKERDKLVVVDGIIEEYRDKLSAFKIW